MISLGDFAFAKSNVSSITIPKSVITIGDGAFANSDLTSIEVAADNLNYSSIDGVLFNKDKTVLILYPPGRQGAYTIPGNVTHIGFFAFANSTYLTSITIPPSVTFIDESAFHRYPCR